ncbi:MAG: signal peptidase I [Gemmatimonadota bacterium]|nr:signal peptidase I [Gemmatimonadota bacterium]
MKSSSASRREAAPPPKLGGRGTGRAPEKKPKGGSESWEWIKSLLIAVVLFLVIRTFLIQAFTIPSGSMENTLLIGDYLMANNAIYGAHVPFTNIRTPAFREPAHGDIVVFRPEYNHPVLDVVKRVIGLPGDTLQMIEGEMYRNGRQLIEPYAQDLGVPDHPIELTGGVEQSRQGIDPQSYGYHSHLSALVAQVDRQSYAPTREQWGPLVVPERHYFLMGDNRDASLDSRYMGFIPREVIRGKAMFIYYSIDPFADRPFPRFLTAARWGRLGTVIR